MRTRKKTRKLFYCIIAPLALGLVVLQSGCGNGNENEQQELPAETVVKPAATEQKQMLLPGTFEGDEKTAQYYANKWYQKATALWNRNGAGYSDPDSAFHYIENALYYYEFAAGYNMRGQVKVQLGKIQEAIPDYDRAIALDSTLAQPYFNRGTAYYILSDMAKACESWKKAAALGMQNAKMAIQQYCI
jgi:tetratricopeptide (TPR) repeat protein